MNRKLLVFAGLAVLLVGLPLLSKCTRGSDVKEVEVVTVAPGTVRSSILSSGALAYREEVQLRPEVVGKVARVTVEEGDTVEAGQLIIALDREQYEAQAQQQHANVRLQEIAIERQKVLIENLARQVERQRELHARGLVDSSTFESAANELALAEIDLRSRQESLSQARATLAQANDNLARTEIRSPIDGIVIKLDIKPGEAVITGTTNVPGSELAIIADPSAMLAEVEVDEADIAKVRIGQDAAIFASAFPDTPLDGVVETIAASATRDQAKQNLFFEVKIRLHDPGRQGVLPGMSARAEIYTESSEGALAVPLQSVLYDTDREAETEQAYVFVVDGDKAVRRDVEIGLSSDTTIELTAGIQEGDVVVSGPFRSLRNLRDGDAVKIVQPKKPGAEPDAESE